MWRFVNIDIFQINKTVIFRTKYIYLSDLFSLSFKMNTHTTSTSVIKYFDTVQQVKFME